ncbi:MAG: TPM domain-containing protein [Chloroflexi bacterium]|nr:TPM domain-containing protein [Chloroflexota bacterium]
MRASGVLRIVILLWTMAVALAVPGLALAQQRLQSQVTDLTHNQVLASGRPQIDAALANLRETRNIQLFVLFTDTTGALTVTDYANQVAARSSLGGNDVLLVVAVTDRSDALWRSAQMTDRLTDRELSDILSDHVEPALARGDFTGAVVAAATGIGQAVVTTTSPSGPLTGSDVPWSVPIVIAGVVVSFGLGLWLWKAVSRRRREHQAAEERDRQIERLDQEANALLIQADDALSESEQEIGFAEAQFGEAAVLPYREAVSRASEELTSAFTLRQQLDDAQPETPEQRRDMVGQMLEHATRAKTALDEQRQRIEAWRDLERRAPEILAKLPAHLDALEARVPEIEKTLASVQRYADQNWTSVAENVSRARELLTTTRGMVEAGQQALTTGDRSTAGRNARLGQHSVAEIGQLLDAVQSLSQDLQKAEAAAGPQIAETTADISAARSSQAERVADSRAPSGQAPNGGTSVDVNQRLAEAEGLLARARQALAQEKPDVLGANRLATQADALADAVLAELRQDEARRERERRILEAQLLAAETSYARADRYITARRRGVGRAARTRLTEAARYLSQARTTADTDPRSALADARRAQELADEAYALARQDFDGIGGYGGFGGYSRGGVFPVPFPIPMGGWGGGWGGGGGSVGGGWGGGTGGSVGGRW